MQGAGVPEGWQGCSCGDGLAAVGEEDFQERCPALGCLDSVQAPGEVG